MAAAIPINFEPPSLNNPQIGVCADDHKYDFYCTNCKSLICANCWVLKHIGDLKDHEAVLFCTKHYLTLLFPEILCFFLAICKLYF